MEGRALMPINFQYHVDDKTYKDTIIISYKPLIIIVNYNYRKEQKKKS